MNVVKLATPDPPAPRAKVLGNIKRERRKVPSRVVLYGPPGIGKSTFAAAAPESIFIGAEDGTSELCVARYPLPIARWKDLIDAIDVLGIEEHEYRTVVIDTLDWAEPLCWTHVAQAAGKKFIEDIGYKAGYNTAVDEWRFLLSRLDMLRDKVGMHVVLLAHSHVKTFKNPEGEDYDRYTMKMHEKASGVVHDWCDAMLFANYETYATKEKQKTKAFSTGARVIYTERRAAFDAKNRYSLPEKLPLDWSEFWTAVEARRPEEPHVTIARIQAMLGELGELDAAQCATVRPAVEKYVGTIANDAVALMAAANKLSVRVQAAKENAL